MVKRSLVLVAAAGLLAGCGDAVGPPDSDLQPLLWAPEVGTATFAARSTGSAPDVLGSGAQQTAQASLVTLDNYQTSFRAVKGKETSAEVHYRAADGTWKLFARFTVPAGAVSESVRITMTVNPDNLDIEFQPDGLKFSPTTPAQIQVSYAGASPDLDRNGKVDSRDAQLLSELTIGLQNRPEDPFEILPVSHQAAEKILASPVYHFSKARAGVKRGGVAVSF